MRAIQWFTVVALVFGLTGPATAQRTTAEDAVRRAEDYCRRIGVTVSGQPTATFPAALRGGSGPQRYFQERWRVRFPSGAIVEIADATGVITEYSHDSVFGRIDANAAPGPAIPVEQALKTAETALAATGQAMELGPHTVRESFSVLPPRAGGHFWTVSWGRLHQGVPFYEDHVTAMIHAETGDLRVLALIFPSPPQPNSSIKPLMLLKRDQSRVRAESFLKGLGADRLELLTDHPLPTGVVLVQPNRFWEDENSNRRIPGPVRPAWLLLYKVGDKNAYLLYIDTQSGAVIGGQNASPLGGPFPFKRPAKSKAVPPKAKKGSSKAVK